LAVTGATGAVGKTHLTCANWGLRERACANGAHPAAESPRPCAKMMLAVCLLRGSTMKGLGMVWVGRG